MNYRIPIIMLLLLTLCTPVFAATTTYVYDELDRVKEVTLENGQHIIYEYDKIGNRLQVITNPRTDFTASPISGNFPLTVYFTDTSTGNPTSWLWTFGEGTAQSAQQNTSYTFDSAGTYTVSLTTSNTSGSNTMTKTNYITVQSCSTASHVKIKNKAAYATLQNAYDNAVAGDTIQLQAQLLTDNLTANRDIAVSLEGGYLCDFSSNPGVTTLQGSITTTINGGTLTIGDIILLN